MDELATRGGDPSSRPNVREAAGESWPAEQARRWRGFFDAHEQELAERAKWLLFWRLIVAVVCLTILLIREGGVLKTYPNAYALIVFVFPLTLSYLAVYRRTRDLETFIIMQVVVDVLFETALVYLTGGVYNVGFGFLYFLSILSASLLISDRAGLILASIVTVCQATVAVVYRLSSDYEVVPPFLSRAQLESLDLEWKLIIGNLIGAGVGYHLVAALAALLPYRVTRVRLLYDEILDSMREGLIAIDNSGRIAFVNREARRLLNWDGVGRMVGRRYVDLLKRREDRKVLEILTRDTDVHEEVELEIRGRGSVAVEAKTAILRDAAGKLRGVIGMFADATLRRTLIQMETRLARLESTHEMALGIAHELRNPLASIRGAVQELVRADDARFSDDDRRLAEVVRRESDRLDRLIEEFLAFARVRPPERRSVDVVKVVEESVMLLTSRADARDVVFEQNVTRVTALTVSGDAEQLRQVCLNIGINAIQAMKGRGRLVISIAPATLPSRAAREEGVVALAARRGVEITFDDDGPGVLLEDRSRVFTPFFSTKKGGLGLGLAIVQKIVRDHEGDIACETPPAGKGTRFRLVLPLADGKTGDTSKMSVPVMKPVGEPLASAGGSP